MRNCQRGGIIARLIKLLFLVAFLFCLWVFRHPILRLAGGFWVAGEEPAAADAILILGDDDYEAHRAAKAAELYRDHWAPTVVASGRYLRPYASIAQLMQRDLTDRGVPSSAVVVFAHRARNTHEELLALRKFSSEHEWRHVLVVTSNFHTRRTRYILRRVWVPGYEFRVIAAESVYDPSNWWESRESVKIFFYESLGLIVAAWELSGSN